MQKNDDDLLPHFICQAYTGTIDYGAQVPFVLHNGAMFTHANMSAHGMPFYHQNVRPGRRHDNSEATLALRSPLLDEFRANKTRKWELRVCRLAWQIVLSHKLLH